MPALWGWETWEDTEKTSGGNYSCHVSRKEAVLKYLAFSLGNSNVKEFAWNAGGLSLIPRLGISPGGEHSNPLWYSCLEEAGGGIPATEEAGGLQSMGSQRLGHDWATNTTTILSTKLQLIHIFWGKVDWFSPPHFYRS